MHLGESDTSPLDGTVLCNCTAIATAKAISSQFRRAHYTFVIVRVSPAGGGSDFEMRKTKI